VALVLFAAIFDWNSLRGPVERYASRSMGRVVTIGHLDVRWYRLTPNVVLSDVTVGNAEWVGAQPMGKARELMFDVRLLSVLTDEIVIPHLRVTGGEVGFVRDAQGRANWRFRDPDQPRRRNVRVLTLAVDDVRVAYRDALNDLSADLHGATRKEGPYETRVQFTGRWRGGAFEGTADTGSVLSLRGSTRPFPMRIVGKAGATRLRAEGEVADITRFRHIDADFAISGPSLASLYQTLKVALPDTPPYQAVGRLKRDDDTYSYENFKGTIGSTDVAGSAKYMLREPRPLLTADLQSGQLDIADLGPIVGVDSARAGATRTAKEPAGKPARRANGTGEQAKPDASAVAAVPGGRVLPDRPFNFEKLNSMDADVRLAAAQLRFPGQVPLRDFAARARLDGGVLTLEPLNFAFAGGDVVAKIVLDARDKPLAGSVTADFKRVQLKQLFPALDKVQQSSGSVGAQVRLNGRGDSVAALLGSANGSVAAGMAGGRVSELAVWLVNLHGGELIPLLFGGDRPTPIRCAAAAMDVRNGIGQLSTFVFDTEESRITATGGVDFRNERLDVTLRPEAKKPGLLSIRGPIHIQGTFRDPDFMVAPQSIARGLGAIALGLVNPILALLPLIETGPGEDTNCRAILEPVKGAVRQSGKSVDDAPKKDETVGREGQAPIVNVAPGQANAGAGRQPQAPIVDVPAKK
jgi:uncharacterized protein involved in outer membrane biogenesis